MKKSFLVKLHIYAGLFTSFYLISLGVSSIVLNHKIDVDNKSITKEWSTSTKIDTSLDDHALALNLRDQLNFMGWTPPWKFKKDTDHFHFEITHLGKTSEISVDLASGKTDIAEFRKGMMAVLHGMHFFNGKIPNGNLLLRSFTIYQYLALLTLLISLVLGLWLWIKFSYQQWELIAFASLFLITILIMTLI
jgi:hypothetical protein